MPSTLCYVTIALKARSSISKAALQLPPALVPEHPPKCGAHSALRQSASMLVGGRDSSRDIRTTEVISAGTDRGQLAEHIWRNHDRAWRRTCRASALCPINVKFMLEGQEEMGSVDLSKTVEKNKDLFSADYAVR